MTAAERRRAVVVAGHRGDIATIRPALEDPDPAVRSSALRALARSGHLDDELGRAFEDPSVAVRRAAAELGADPTLRDPVGLLEDPDASVVEAAAWALGERAATDTAHVTALCEVAEHHLDPLCREAAVAALGALGDQAALDTIIAALDDKPAVRRRAVVALAPFDGPGVEAALDRAEADRDRQVRDAARELRS